MKLQDQLVASLARAWGTSESYVRLSFGIPAPDSAGDLLTEWVAMGYRSPVSTFVGWGLAQAAGVNFTPVGYMRLENLARKVVDLRGW